MRQCSRTINELGASCFSPCMWKECTSRRGKHTIAKGKQVITEEREVRREPTASKANLPLREVSYIIRSVKRFLTTSSRDRWNRRDVICPRQYAREYRNRFQKVNDAFHSAGKKGRMYSFEAITLQFSGVEWSYLILPATLALFVIIFIGIVERRRRGGELLVLQQQVEAWAAERSRSDPYLETVGSTRG
ncbi:hypothetical protein DPX39_080022500 [Trypanosoma brucei equiperdum]|uniref:Uncharacterized protein n=1 Tax=Trypanosoma brucei equiperdum TaxID=630700 RepID=A0A3L6L428_9TRYP|nr:hypothetical protein DPX39_080022500 [Trypanosoma brucei equiperdum]